MKNFFVQIKNSVYSPEFYARLKETGFKGGFGHYFRLALVLGLLLTIYFSITFIPLINAFFSEANAREIMGLYPANLVVTIKNGQANSNAKEPYFVKTPDLLKNWGKNPPKQNSSIENIIVIDTQSEFSISKFREYKTVFLLAKNAIISLDNNNSISIQTLEKIPDTTINKELVDSLGNKVIPYLKFIAPIIILMFFIGLLFYYGIMLAYMLILALVILLTAYLIGEKFSYGEAFKASLYLVTASLISEFILWLFFLPTPFLVPTFLTIIIFILNFRNIPPALPIAEQKE